MPLTRNIDLSSELGTRHRAAIGMSENSDCLVVVVSEESGTISTAHNGVLTRRLNSDTLEAALLQHMMPANAQNRDKRGLFGLFKRKEKDQ